MMEHLLLREMGVSFCSVAKRSRRNDGHHNFERQDKVRATGGNTNRGKALESWQRGNVTARVPRGAGVVHGNSEKNSKATLGLAETARVVVVARKGIAWTSTLFRAQNLEVV